jgi:peptide/nickel transport system permease protein
MRADYIRTARAKGVGPTAVLFKHGVRNAMLPIVTLMGLSLTVLVSGAIIAEPIYGWPGMGRLAFEAIYALDVPIVIGVVVVFCVTVQIGNLLADLAVAALDPRIRLQT